MLYDPSDDESQDIYSAELVWLSNDKQSIYMSLKPIHTNRRGY